MVNLREYVATCTSVFIRSGLEEQTLGVTCARSSSSCTLNMSGWLAFNPISSFFGVVRLAVLSLLEQHRDFAIVLDRVRAPALPPNPHPTKSAWQEPAHPFPDVPLPDEVVDVLIIGSGITGASVARELLTSKDGQSMRVAMVDAREICSGATVSPLSTITYSDPLSRSCNVREGTGDT
jgi:hypothetical protein